MKKVSESMEIITYATYTFDNTDEWEEGEGVLRRDGWTYVRMEPTGNEPPFIKCTYEKKCQITN